MTSVLSAEAPPDRTAVQTPRRRWTADELRSDLLGLRSQCPHGEVAVVRSDDAAVVAAAFVALDSWSSAVHLVPDDVSPTVAGIELRLDVPSHVGDGSPVSAGDTTTTWYAYTSGTTGTPEPVGHRLESLTRRVVRSPKSSALTWGLLYDPNRMAGIQVLLQGLGSAAPVIAPDRDVALAERISFLVHCGVDALSATPTMWRLVLQLPVAEQLALTQITLGGEIADQLILDALARRYPRARIVHVFASTETGAAFSVTDGRAGFPVDYLDNPPQGIALQVRDDTLFVHSPHVDGAGADGFVSTGDVVDVVGDRVLFRGRATGVVNVGGASVWPEEVEGILRAHPSVVDAVVLAKSNPIAGNVLVASVVPTADTNPEGLAKALRRHVRQRATRSHVPATIEVVEALTVSAAGKAERR